MYLLDTNVLWELRHNDRTDRKVAAWADGAHVSELFLSAITILEIEAGTLKPLHRDPVRGTVLRIWIDHRVLPAFKGWILPVDTEVAQRCASLHIPHPRAERDVLIAVTALVHRLKVVRWNVSGFEPTGVAVLNPWNRSA